MIGKVRLAPAFKRVMGSTARNHVHLAAVA